MKGLDRFGSAVADAGSAAVQRVLADNPLPSDGWATHLFFGGPLHRSGTAPKVSVTERFTLDLLQKFSEIANSSESLNSIYKVIRRAPASATGVEPTRHLRLSMEAWLHETYILRERCTAFLKFLERSYRADPRAANIRATTKEVRKRVDGAFSGVTQVRSSHVHQLRYDDEDLQRLSTLSLLASQNDIYKAPLKAATRTVRSTKATWMAERNIEVQHLLDRYFASLYDIVFDADGRPQFPGAA